MSSLYKIIFKKAVALTWKNKLFWFLGLFTILFSTSVEVEMVNNFFGQNKYNVYNFRSLFDILNFKSGSLLQQSFVNNQAAFMKVLGYFLIILVVLVLLLALASLVQVMIVKTTVQNLKNEGKIIKKYYFWPQNKNETFLVLKTAFLNFCLKIAINLLLFIIILPVLFNPNQNPISGWLYVVLFIIFFPLSIVLAFIIRYMLVYTIIDNLSLKAGINKGWETFKNNWLVSIEMALLMFLTNIAGSLILVYIILALVNPLTFLAYLVAKFVSQAFFLYIFGFIYIFALALFALGSSWLSVFNINAWVALINRFNKKDADSKLVRVFDSLTQK